MLYFTNTFTLSERSWIASVSVLGQLVSALISGFVSNSIGRKNCLLLFNIPLLVGWLMLIFHQGNFYVCLFARILQGFGVIPSIGKIHLHILCNWNLSVLRKDSWNYDILLPNLFWPTVRKNCSSDPEKRLKFEA